MSIKLPPTPEKTESPDCHKDILDERRDSVAEKAAQFEDWETAKAKIRAKVSVKTS